MKVIQTDFQRKYGWIISAVLSVIMLIGYIGFTQRTEHLIMSLAFLYISRWSYKKIKGVTYETNRNTNFKEAKA